MSNPTERDLTCTPLTAEEVIQRAHAMNSDYHCRFCVKKVSHDNWHMLRDPLNHEPDCICRRGG